MSPLRDLWRLLFPEVCIHCGKALAGNERHLCTRCLALITWRPHPVAGQAQDGVTRRMNDTEMRIVGHIVPQLYLVAADSLFLYQKGHVSQSIIHAMKYHGNTALIASFGAMLGEALRQSGRFGDIDFVVPVPLHPLRRWHRGYNQSELLARAVARVLDCQVSAGNLYRRHRSESQTHKNRLQRMENVSGLFALRHPERFCGKHLLLIDDVITTGATVGACCQALAAVPGLRVSVASLALTAV